MRRGFVVLLAVCLISPVFGTSALAQSYPPSGQASPAVEAATEGSAFTGGDLGAPMVAGLVLLTVGVFTLVVARRRADRFLSEEMTLIAGPEHPDVPPPPV